MKTYKRSMFPMLAVMVTLAASCTKDVDCGRFSGCSTLSIGTVTTEKMLTRSVITGTTFPAEEAAKGIGLFLTATDGGNYDGQTSGYSNIKYSDGGSGWVSDSPIMLSATEGVLYGYFPYSASVTDLTAVPVESSLDGTDYMYAAPVTGVNRQNPATDITMNHALARLSIKFVKGASYTGAGSFTAFSMESKGLSSSGKMNAKTGSVTPDGANSVSYTVTEILTTDGIIEECLLVPTTDSDRKLTLKCTIDGKEYSLDFSGADTLCIRSGVNFTAKLTLTDKGLSISSTGIGDWKEGTEPEMELDGGCKVTVKYSDETGIAEDVFLDITSDGSSVTIKTHAALTGRLIQCACTPEDKATCDLTIDEATGICTFTISDVQENITVEVGYLECGITVFYDSKFGAVKLNGDDIASGIPVYITKGGEAVFAVTENSKIPFSKWTDGSGSVLSTDNLYTISHVTSDMTLNAVFIEGALPGLFTVNDSGKKVVFSKGNLWCDTNSNPQNSNFHFEDNQYKSQPISDGERVESHISHFLWCDDVSKAVSLLYDDSWDGANTFFTDKADFAVNGVSAWRTLNAEEWRYLLSGRRAKNVSGVTIDGATYKGVFIYPDDYNGEEVGKGGPDTWSDINEAGIVFLPATGRSAGLVDRSVEEVGATGFYWSGSPLESDFAGNISFQSGEIRRSENHRRLCAYSVRLVADYEE